MFNETVLTKKGIALNNKAQAGYAAIEYLRVGLGKGIYEKNEKLEDQENLKEEKQSVPISSIKIIDEKTVKLRVVINNEGITEGYDITEIGLYATDPDEGEILYSVANATDGKVDYQPSKMEVVDYQITIDLYSTVSNTNNVTIKLDTGAAASAADLIQLKEDMSKGDISETVIETLDTVEDKYPIPAAGESVKRFFGKVLTFLRNIRPLTGDISIYVSTTGSDATGDGTSAKPFKTIQHAIDILPKDLNGYVATIQVADGTYNESIVISGFKTGIIHLKTIRNDTISSLTKVTSITCQHNSAYVVIHGFDVITTLGYGITCVHCANIIINSVRCVGVAKTFRGIYIEESGICRVLNCEISNKEYAVYITNANGYVMTSSGTGNTYGILSASAGIVHILSSSIGATIPISQSYGGIIVYENGTQIRDVTSAGLSCTWGTISGGYIRHGNIVGTAMVTIQCAVNLSISLSAGIAYIIAGFPPCPGISVAVSVHDQADFYFCQLNPDGNLVFQTNKTITAGNYFLFNCTYLTLT